MNVSRVTMDLIAWQEQETAWPSRWVSHRRMCHHSSPGNSDHAFGRTNTQPSSSDAQSVERYSRNICGEVSDRNPAAFRVHTASAISPERVILIVTRCISAREQRFCKYSTVSPPPGERTASLPPPRAARAL